MRLMLNALGNRSGIYDWNEPLIRFTCNLSRQPLEWMSGLWQAQWLGVFYDWFIVPPGCAHLKCYAFSNRCTRGYPIGHPCRDFQDGCTCTWKYWTPPQMEPCGEYRRADTALKRGAGERLISKERQTKNNTIAVCFSWRIESFLKTDPEPGFQEIRETWSRGLWQDHVICDFRYPIADMRSSWDRESGIKQWTGNVEGEANIKLYNCRLL